MKKLVLLLLFLSSTTFAQGREFKVVNVDADGNITDSTEVVDLKNLFNSLVHDLNEQISNQRRGASALLTEKASKFDVQITRLERLRDSLNEQELKDGVQVRIDRVAAAKDDLTRPRREDEADGRKEKRTKAGPIIARLNRQLNDVDRALRAAER